jgi:hypothetical protein
VYPVIVPGGSDSASIDNAVEFLFQSGRSLPHVMAMLIPEAWSGNPEMDPKKRAFYEYHASLMEPWDGPASVCFTDGRVVGATLDRNGLRPGRYIVTKDDLVVLASEAGVIGYGGASHYFGRGDQAVAGRPPALCGVAEGAAGVAGRSAGAVEGDHIGPGDFVAPPARLRVQRGGP